MSVGEVASNGYRVRAMAKRPARYNASVDTYVFWGMRKGWKFMSVVFCC